MTTNMPQRDEENDPLAEMVAAKEMLDIMELEDRAVAEHEHRKKKFALWVAVGGTTAFIVALWVLLLPLQLKKGGLLTTEDAARWQQAGPAATRDRSFGEVMDDIRQKIEYADQDLRDSQSGAAARMEIERLREKIEARNGGTDGNGNANVNQ